MKGPSSPTAFRCALRKYPAAASEIKHVAGAMKTWRFTYNPRWSAWSWKVLEADAVHRLSDREFTTMYECFRDARDHGYNACCDTGEAAVTAAAEGDALRYV